MSTTASSLPKWIGRFVKAFLVSILMITLITTFIVKTSGDSNAQYTLNKQIVNDITGLNPISVKQIISPKSIDEISAAIKNSTGPLSIGGGRYSQGGQTAYENSIHLDMRKFNQVIDFNAEKKEITVQAGITWRDIQEYIDPYNLSIKIMQTYANFTVGGSLSVNVHGRYIGEGPIVNAVNSIKLVMADGSIVVASSTENKSLFYGAIGGYGGLGVIAEASLALADNTKIERKVKPLPVSQYKDYFFNNIRNNSNIIFHNADLYPPRYEDVLDVSWYRTEKPLTNKDRLIARGEKYFWGPRIVDFVAKYDLGKALRKNIIDPVYYAFDRVVWRNWEASYDVRELEPENREETTYVLREYFVPVENIDRFIVKMRDIFQSNDANIINVSIRHAHQDPGTLLAWASQEVFAFVVYYQQGTDEKAKEQVKKWSTEMIDAVIEHGGTYYLPYQIFASPEQFRAAYPRSSEFFSLKAKVDPEYRFRNQLWKQHYSQDQKNLIKNYHRGEEQTFLTIPEWYLVFNPLEYVQFLENGQNPSDFPFFSSINEYWTLYDRVLAMTDGIYPKNSEYITMLQVIGISTTVEYMFKGLYENTLGRISRWTANGQNTPEDQIITQAHRAYSNLIFDQAWYKFDFWHWVRKIWQETDFFGNNFIRKLERKIFFTLEFGFKTIYAKLIGFSVQTAYEQSEGLIYLTVEKTDGIDAELPKSTKIVAQSDKAYLLSIPRWDEFTKTIPLLVKQGFNFLDISGNDLISMSLLSDQYADKLSYSDHLFGSELVSNKGLIRSFQLVKTPELSKAITEASQQGFTIEHLYDY